jgi:predicted nucleic acid-binding protein
MKCLDTSLLIDLTRGRPKAAEAVERALEDGAITTELNAFELYAGAHESGRPVEETMAAIARILRRIDVLPLTRQASLRAASILSLLRSRGQDIGTLDTLIAAISLVHGIDTIVTDNVIHFRRVPGIKVETY